MKKDERWTENMKRILIFIGLKILEVLAVCGFLRLAYFIGSNGCIDDTPAVIVIIAGIVFCVIPCGITYVSFLILRYIVKVVVKIIKFNWELAAKLSNIKTNNFYISPHTSDEK